MSREKPPERRLRSRRRTVYAPPQPKGHSEHPAVISVELDEDEDVEWIWTHISDGEASLPATP